MLAYQLDFVIPGISPSRASSRKQIRQRANFRINARGRPHRLQRLCCWTLNLGVRNDFAIADFFAKSASALRRCSLERHTEQLEESARLGITPRARDHGDFHAADAIDPVVVDLGKDQLLAQADRVIAATVEPFVWHPTEVADPRERDIDKPIEELVHSLATESDADADRHPFAQTEAGD